MDETYVKVRGEWVYLYRAVDKAGKTVDFYLSEEQDDRRASSSPEAERDNKVPSVLLVECHRVIVTRPLPAPARGGCEHQLNTTRDSEDARDENGMVWFARTWPTKTP
jgi:hypothetical protein